MTIVVFMDLEKTFDMLWRDGIILQLNSLGISRKMVRWLQDFMIERFIEVRVGDSLSQPHKLENLLWVH